MEVDYSGHADPVSSDALAELTRLGQELASAQFEADKAKDSLAAKQKRVKDLEENHIPELMDQIGMERFTTREGFVIKIVEDVHGNITKEKAPEAFRWLEENGHGHIIKRNVTVEFGVKEAAKAAKLVESVQGEYPGVHEKKSVHSSTLGAWIRELLRNGKPVPKELFGVHERRVAKLG